MGGFLGFLGGVANTLGQAAPVAGRVLDARADRNARALALKQQQDMQQQTLALQKLAAQRQGAQQDAENILAMAKYGATPVAEGEDATAQLQGAQRTSDMRSGVGTAIPNQALGLPAEGNALTPNFYGRPVLRSLPTASGGKQYFIQDPSQTPEAQQERRDFLKTRQAGEERAADETRKAAQAQTQMHAQGEAAFNHLRDWFGSDPRVQRMVAAGRKPENDQLYLDELNHLQKLEEVKAGHNASSEPGEWVEDPNNPGTSIYVPRSQAFGMKKVPTGMGMAAIRRAVANNQTQAATIDDAIAEIEAHPTAIGWKRGLADVIPHTSGVSDKINQIFDKEGVAARAALANISSLIIHDRSGAAVTVSEMKRLAPFIPGNIDNATSAITKLRKLKQQIGVETDALSQQMAGAAPSGAPVPGGAKTAGGDAKARAAAFYEQYQKNKGTP